MKPEKPKMKIARNEKVTNLLTKTKMAEL